MRVYIYGNACCSENVCVGREGGHGSIRLMMVTLFPDEGRSHQTMIGLCTA